MFGCYVLGFRLPLSQSHFKAEFGGLQSRGYVCLLFIHSSYKFIILERTALKPF